MNYDSDYLNGSDETYYYNGTEGTNHAVLLVGWDDNKVVTGGIATPSSAGAWIIRNSWGPSWGESGYFYISYEDTKALKSVAYFPTTQTYNSESSVYSYDELGWCTSIGYSDGDDRALTKFTATGNQEIQSIGTFVNTASCNIDIYIYGSFTGSSLGNLLGSITSQTCEWPGYYSFDLASPVSISNGSDFYVVVRYSNCGDYPIPVESAIADYSSTATFETGKCWISNTGSSWLPIGSGTDYAYDAGIKVYATDIASISPEANFMASQTIVSVGQTVNFTDLSTGVPDSWDWTFEGAQTISSSDQHPSTVWTTPGTYDISLTASNSFGFDTETKTDYIIVTSVPMTCDTMSNMQEDDNLTYYTVGDYGFISGHNSYLMNQFAEYYEAPVHNNLTGLTVAVAKADAMSGNAIISMKVWDNVGGFPGNELYSEDFNITDFTAQSYNNIDFTTGVDVPNEFFIGYEVYYETPMDTFAVYQAQARPSSSTHDSTAFVKYNNNWYNLGGLFSDGFNSSYSIEPILCPAAPTANFIADQTEGCENLTVQFTDMSTGNAEDWSWDFGDGNTSTEQNPEHMYSSPGQYTVSLTVSNVIGEDTFTQTNLIQVFTNPTVNLGTDTDFCEGGSVSLNAGTGMTQYNWSPSGTGQTVEANTAGTWSVTVTDSHGCTASDNINLTELTAPSIDLGSDMTVCDTEIPVILDAGSGMASYIWSPSGDSQTISVNTSGTYSVIVEGSNGCTSSDQIEVSVLQTPVPGFSPSYIELCDYDAPVTLDPGTGSLYNYSWSNGSDSETIEVTESGNYTVTVSAGSCSAEASIDVHVEASPNAFNLLGGGQIDEGTGAEIYLSGEEDDVSYYLNHETDGIVATELSGDHSFGSFTSAGTYTAYAVSDTANCMTDMNGEVEIIITNLSEFTLSPIEVFPNPATTYLNIQSGQTIEKISFYAMDGKCIKSVEHPDQHINIEDLPSGNFLIHIQTKETTIIKNLIVN